MPPMGKVMKKRKQATLPPKILMITGASGVGKTHFVQHKFLGLRGKVKEDIEEMLGRCPLKRSTLKGGKGIKSQVTWHSVRGGKLAVVGGYAFDGDKRWAAKWRWKVPPTGGSDLLIPQCSEYLAKLLCGDAEVLEQHGLPMPKLVVMEACTVAKVNKAEVLDALLSANKQGQLFVLQLTKPRDQAIAAFAARGREHDGGVVKGRPADQVHDEYKAQVQTIHEKLQARAAEERIAWDDAMVWKELPYTDAAAYVAAPENGFSEYVA